MGAKIEKKLFQKRAPKIDVKKGRDCATAWVVWRLGRDATSNILSIFKRLLTSC